MPPPASSSFALARRARAEDEPVHAYYAGYAHGFNVLNLDTTLILHPGDYRLQVSYRLAGVVGTLVHGDATTTVDGRFVGGMPSPVSCSAPDICAATPRDADRLDGRLAEDRADGAAGGERARSGPRSATRPTPSTR